MLITKQCSEKNMATKGKYLHTWKLKLATAKMVSEVFHLN